VRGLGAEQLGFEHVQSGEPVDLGSQAVGEVKCGCEQVVAVLGHLSPPPVDRGIEQHVRAGGHQ
jgi:hypothetical protein